MYAKKLIPIFLSVASFVSCSNTDIYIGLTTIPYGTITDKVDIDVRAGIVNNSKFISDFRVKVFLGDENNLIFEKDTILSAGEYCQMKSLVSSKGLQGENTIALEVVENGRKTHFLERTINVIPSDVRSNHQIDGAWCGIYHWSEEEGLHWNKDIKQMSDDQWKELVRAMHSIRMDGIVIQEVFRNQEYVGDHNMTMDTYSGRAFYPSKLYRSRIDMITANDPVEAILSQADELDMNVLVGVGMWAWFDFSAESLKWHKAIAKELWEMYGHHKSFYGFYISEECDGSLTTYSPSLEEMKQRQEDIVDFFKEIKAYCLTLAPDKPVMLATNSMNVSGSVDVYRELLKNLDILCPFGFARMPENDLTGKEAADLLQSLCNEYGSHLWFDLEAFLFNPDMSLYPKPIEQIISELNLLDNFEKVLTYQFPGVFNDPEMSIRIGEERTIQLFNDYKNYLKQITPKN